MTEEGGSVNREGGDASTRQQTRRLVARDGISHVLLAGPTLPTRSRPMSGP